jgi:hypothetical protein
MITKTSRIIYWVTTILFAAFMIYSSIGGLKPTPETVAFLHDYLGYPIYFIRFISIAKIIGAVTLLIPGLRSIKEWAYAGLIFDLVGAFVSVIAVAGKVEPGASFIVLAIVLGMTSYFLWKKR